MVGVTTRTEKFVTVWPPSPSSAVTVIVAVPTATGVTVSVKDPAMATVVTPALLETAVKASVSPSASLKTVVKSTVKTSLSRSLHASPSSGAATIYAGRAS